MRISKVVTRKGDTGTTSLGDGTTVSKSSMRIRCIGEIDELNSFVGSSKIYANIEDDFSLLNDIQNNLFNIGGELSVPESKNELLKENSVTDLEERIKLMNKELPPLKEFILPGGNEFSARLHIARSVCRRVERNIIELVEIESGSDLWIKYLNRLSDYLFVLARYQNKNKYNAEQQWEKTN